MILLKDLRGEVRQKLGAPCMLRVGREDDCLFVTDAPKRLSDSADAARDALQTVGWDVRPSGGLWRLDLGEDRWHSFIRSVPREEGPDPMEASLQLYSLAKRLTRAPVPAEDQPLLPLRVVFKALDSGKAEAVTRFFPPYLAGLLREKKPMPEAAGWILTWAMNRGIF